MKDRKLEALSVPNILSYIRILLVPVFAVLYMSANTQGEYLAAALVLLLSGLTDLLDGIIARRFAMVTELGKLLDPAADKLTQATVAVCLAIRIPGMPFLLAVFIVKELIMAAASIFLITKGGKIDGSKWFGKLATAVFYTVMVLIIAMPGISETARLIMIGGAAAVMLFALIRYIPMFFSILHTTKSEKPDDTEHKGEGGEKSA